MDKEERTAVNSITYILSCLFSALIMNFMTFFFDWIMNTQSVVFGMPFNKYYLFGFIILVYVLSGLSVLFVGEKEFQSEPTNKE